MKAMLYYFPIIRAQIFEKGVCEIMQIRKQNISILIE